MVSLTRADIVQGEERDEPSLCFDSQLGKTSLRSSKLMILKLFGHSALSWSSVVPSRAKRKTKQVRKKVHNSREEKRGGRRRTGVEVAFKMGPGEVPQMEDDGVGLR